MDPHMPTFCMHTHPRTYTHTGLRSHTHAYTHAHTQCRRVRELDMSGILIDRSMSTQTHTHTHAHARTHPPTHPHTHTHTHTRTHTHTYNICAHRPTLTHTHTHICIHSHSAGEYASSTCRGSSLTGACQSHWQGYVQQISFGLSCSICSIHPSSKNLEGSAEKFVTVEKRYIAFGLQPQKSSRGHEKSRCLVENRGVT